MDFWHNAWAMFTNDGLYTTGETIAILVLSLLITAAFFYYVGRKTTEENRLNMIADLGYDGYLRHRLFTQKLGRDTD